MDATDGPTLPLVDLGWSWWLAMAHMGDMGQLHSHFHRVQAVSGLSFRSLCVAQALFFFLGK